MPAPTVWRGDPRDVRPMLAEAAPAAAHPSILDRPDARFEPKYDGIRALVALDGVAPPRICTRLGRDKTEQFPDLVEPLAALGRHLRRPLLLDGEIVAVGGDGTARPFQYLQDRLHVSGGAVRAAAQATAAALVVFDLLRDGEADLRPLPLHERRRRLERLLRRRTSDKIRLIDSQVGDGTALAAHGRERGWEGVVVKQPDGRYFSGRRSATWQKVKFTESEEFVVGGWTSPRGSRPHFGALLLGYYPAGGERASSPERLVFAGQVGTGFTAAELDRIAARLLPLETGDCPFAELPAPLRAETRRWVSPSLVAQVTFTQWTRDGVLRHPVYDGLRGDKRPDEVRRAALRPSPDRAAAGAAARSRGARAPSGARAAQSGPVTRSAPAPRRPARSKRATRPVAAPAARIPPDPHPEPAAGDLLAQLEDLERTGRRSTLVLSDGARVPVGNLGKVFWPAGGVTKGELVRFYLRMAPYLLPVVADRPLVMKRFPNGVEGKSFYQHRAPNPLPEGIRVTAVRESPEKPHSEVPYLVGGRLQTLLYMAQLGVISQDPWFSRLPDTQAADMAALDLDPMPETTFDRILHVACWLHDELERLGVPSFAKTSGSGGLHIFIPLPPGTPYEAGMIFCQILATVVAEAHPEAATVERMVRQRRPDAVYIDYLQNIHGKTLACAYSARASPFAGVSTPLTWAEVHEGAAAGLRPHDFTMRSVFARLDRAGDVWAGLRGSQPADLEAVFAYGAG